MRDRAPSPQSGSPAKAPAAAPKPGRAGRVLAMQQAAGNRATGRVLARWTKHPDPEQKGVMVPDSSAADFGRFNPPQNA